MKRYFLLIILLLSSINVTLAQLKSQVNECFELTSIAFRLADAKEYVNNDISAYTGSIDKFFLKHHNHKLISHIRNIRDKYEIGYDVVAAAASFLDIRNGKVVIQAGIGISQINEVDSRWTEQDFGVFVNLLNDFYRDANFRSFYTKHTDLYKLTEKRIDEVLKEFNIDWFSTLFKDIQEPLVIVSLCNGPHNYAFSIPSKNNRNGMVVGCVADSEGLPVFNKNLIFIIAHEFLHSYTNSCISNSWNQIGPAAQVIYSHAKEDMGKLAYKNAETTMNEWFTNLLSIMYLQDNPTMNYPIQRLIGQHQNAGFIWMERSVIFMEHFRKDRNTFTTIDDYMPQIIGFINNTAKNYNQVLFEYDNRQPYIVDAFPAPGSLVKTDIDTIKIYFSEPMITADGLSPIDDENIIPIQWIAMPSWESKRTFTIPIDKNKLDSGKTDGIKLDHQYFQSEKRYSIKEDYIYTFKTCD